MATTLSWNVMLSLMITISPVTFGFLTHIPEEVSNQDSKDLRMHEENEREKQISEGALQKLQEVLGLPDMREKRHHQTPPQFMTELYHDIVEQNGLRNKNPFNARIIRSFIERDNSMSHFFYFNISGLNVMEKVLEAQLRLYRMKTPAQEIHHTFFTSPSLIIRVYQVLDDLQLTTPDVNRLLSSHMIGTHTHGWEVFNVKEAVLDWVSGRRPNNGLLVTTTTLFEQNVDVKFARRNEHHNSKQPILVLFDDDIWPSGSPLITFADHGSGSPEYYEYQNQVRDSSGEDDPARRRRSLASSTSTITSTTTAATSTANSTTSNPANFIHGGQTVNTAGTSTSGECQRYELVVDFQRIGWSDWIIAPSNYTAYHCKGHCNFPLGQSLKPTNHATVQSIVHKYNLAPGVDKPCCVPTILRSLEILYYDNNESIVLRRYEDMIAETCGCH